MRGALGFAVTSALMANGVIGGRMMMRPALAANEPVAAPSAPFAAMMIPHHEARWRRRNCTSVRIRSCAASRKESSSSGARKSM